MIAALGAHHKAAIGGAMSQQLLFSHHSIIRWVSAPLTLRRHVDFLRLARFEKQTSRVWSHVKPR
jgi:hypothetical protein